MKLLFGSLSFLFLLTGCLNPFGSGSTGSGFGKAALPVPSPVPPISANLTSTGSNNSVDFGSVNPGSAAQSITFTNSGSENAFSISGSVSSGAGDFGFPSGAFPGGGLCPDPLPAGSSCTINIQFNSNSPVGPKSGAMTLSYSDSGGTHSLTVTLRGTSLFQSVIVNPGSQDLVKALVPMNDTLGRFFALGAFGFTRVNGFTLLQMNGLRDTSFNNDGFYNSFVNCGMMAKDFPTEIIVGGNFSSYYQTIGAGLFGTPLPRPYLARFRSDGGLINVPGFNPPVFDHLVQAIAPADASGDFYVGGAFTAVNGDPTKTAIVRLNSDGTIDTAYGNTVVGTVQAIAVDTNGDAYIGGSFPAGVAKLSGGSVYISWAQPSFVGAHTVFSIALSQDGQYIYVAGDFTYNGTDPIGSVPVATHNLVRLKMDGSPDSTFAIGGGLTGPPDGATCIAGPGGCAHSVTLAPDGSGDVYVGGMFTAVNYATPVSVQGIVRLTAEGSINSTFDVVGASSGFDNRIWSIVPAGGTSTDILVGGNFTHFKGNSANYIIRLGADGSVQ